MPIKFEWSYAVSVSIGIAASYCFYFPTEAKYITSLNTLNNHSDPDLALTFFAAQWDPSFIYFIPLIVGYLIDTIGVVPMLVPLHFMLTLGQIFLTILSFTDQSGSNNELLAILGYLFISFSYAGVQIAQTVFLINTYISQDKNTREYQKVVLVSYPLNTLASQLPRIWRETSDKKFGVLLGCILAVCGMGICIVLAKSPWASLNSESSYEEEQNMGIAEPLNRSGGDLRKTFSHLNKRGPQTNIFPKKKPLINVYVALVIVGIGCFEYLIETMMQYWEYAFYQTNSKDIGEAWYSYADLVILCCSCLVYAYFSVPKKVLEKLILCTCLLLLLLIVFSKVKYLAIILYIGVLISYPNSIQLYLPYLCNMEFERLGLFLGFFGWIEAIIYMTAIGIGSLSVPGQKNLLNNMINFYWGEPYHDYVAFPLTLIIISTISIYAIKKKYFDDGNKDKDDPPQQLPKPEVSLNLEKSKQQISLNETL